MGTSLAFALTPFWPLGMLSTLGMPLALWAFLNIRSGERSWKNYLVLTLLPVYSSIVLGFFFFLFAMGVFWLTDVIRGKGWNLKFLLSIVYMTLAYCLVDYRLVSSFIFGSEPNSRDEYFHAKLPLWQVIRLIIRNFVLAQILLLAVFNEKIINQNNPSVNEFYAEKLFQNIKEHIAQPQEDYRVVSIGIHPAIAQYNGFYTIHIIIFIR
ncbi:hypothetical protein J2S21_002011 [Peribacillus cavernae]|nr:hypothetical protein [Peribacillus cavernae]